MNSAGRDQPVDAAAPLGGAMQARPLDAFAATLVFALCVVWGFNQVVVKLALPDVGPVAQRDR